MVAAVHSPVFESPLHLSHFPGMTMNELNAIRHSEQLLAIKEFSEGLNPDSYLKLAQMDPASRLYPISLEAQNYLKNVFIASINNTDLNHPDYPKIREFGLNVANTAYWAEQHNVEMTNKGIAEWKRISSELFGSVKSETSPATETSEAQG